MTRAGPAPGLVVAGVLLIAFNLRPAASSLSPVLDAIRSDLGLSHAAIGLLTSIPVLCLGLFPVAAARVAARIGTERALLLAVALIAAATAARLHGDSAGALFATAVAAGVGIAAGQTLVPPVVKRHLPERGATVIALYSIAMTVGAGVGAASTGAMAERLGGWAPALAAWSAPAAAAVALWVPAARFPAAPEPAASQALPWRSPVAWLVTLFSAIAFSVFWSALSWLAPLYREQGWSEAATGAVLLAWTIAQIAASLGVAALAARSPDRRPWMAASLVAGTAGFGGAGLLPDAAPWLWAVALGTCTGGVFPLALALPLDHGADPAEVRGLTAMALSAGYLLAAAWPLAIGWLRGVTGGFAVPFTALALTCAASLLLVRHLAPPRAGGARPR